MYIERPPLPFDVFRHPPEIDTIHTVYINTLDHLDIICGKGTLVLEYA